MEERYWLSTERMTIIATVQNDRITGGSPVIVKFIGQPFVRLINWLEKQGGLIVHQFEQINEVVKCIDNETGNG